MSQIPAEVRERIVAAANELYEELGRETFPTVDTVRRAAKADMNTTSTVMKDWRRQQTAQAAPVAVAVPEAVSQANSAALAAMWQQAQELANESLRAAQASWETEREELDAMRLELANAYEEQAGEFEVLRIEAASEAKAHKAQLEQMRSETGAVRDELAKAVTRAEREEAKAEEINRRADELRAELNRAHIDIDIARKALADEQAVKKSVLAELEQARKELADNQAAAQRDKEESREQATRVRDEIKRLAAQLEVAQTDKERVVIELDSARKEASRAREETAQMAGRMAGYKEQSDVMNEILKRLAKEEIERLKKAEKS